MIFSGVDFEATGLDVKSDRIIEIGAVLFTGDFQEKEIFSQLLWAPDYPRLSAEVTRVTKLSNDELAEKGRGPIAALLKLNTFFLKGELILAFNKEYDEALYKNECARLGVTPVSLPWFCALSEVPYPEHFRCRKLSHLALDHGIAVHPGKLHRAVGDVQLMGELLLTGGYTVTKIQEYAASPWVYLQAVIPAPWEDGGVGKDRARRAGYAWETPRGLASPTFPKLWVKRVREMDLVVEKAQDHGFKRQLLKA